MNKKERITIEISNTVPTFLRHMFPYVFNSLKVPPSQVMALVSIQEHTRCSLKVLKAEMHVTAPTITGIIDRLERDGYVKRSSDRIDKRIKNVALTLKGERVVREFRDNIKKRWGYILSKMPIETGENVLTIMKKITQGFKDGTI